MAPVGFFCYDARGNIPCYRPVLLHQFSCVPYPHGECHGALVGTLWSMESLMTCQEFLVRHAEFMDELLPQSEAARWEAHLAACASCARYDRVIRQGVRILRAAPEVEPSSDFFPRLQHRLYNLEDEMRVGNRGPGAGAMASLAIAGMLALLAWSPLLRLDQVLIPGAAIDGIATASDESRPVAVGQEGTATFVDQNVTVAADPARAPALTAGRAIPGRSTQWRRIDLTGPSTLRPVEVSGEWLAPQLSGRLAGWDALDSLDAFGAHFELLPSTPAPSPSPGESWWWYNASQQMQGVNHGRGLVQQRSNPYPPMLTGARVPTPASAQLHRAADSIPTQH